MKLTALKSASRRKDTLSKDPHPSPEADPRALELLRGLSSRQIGLPLGQALALERVAFAEAFAGPEPGRRVRGFLNGAPDGGVI